jgi:hypothetical protein
VWRIHLVDSSNAIADLEFVNVIADSVHSSSDVVTAVEGRLPAAWRNPLAIFSSPISRLVK